MQLRWITAKNTHNILWMWMVLLGQVWQGCDLVSGSDHVYICAKEGAYSLATALLV